MRPYQHVLFATGLTQDDEEGAQRAAEIARRFRARLTLLHVVPDFPENVPNDPIAPETVDPAQFLVARAYRDLERLARRIGRVRAERKVVFSSGSARHAICDVARDIGADLILLAASGHHLLPGMFSATTSGVLNDACCDVMVIRRGEAARREAQPTAAPTKVAVARRR